MTLRKWISVAVMIMIALPSAWAEEPNLGNDIGKWRDQVVANIGPWQPLIDGIKNASAAIWDDSSEQAGERWRGIRARVVSELEKDPDNPFAADIRLALAIMDAEVLKDKRDAIQTLESVRASGSVTPTIHGAFGLWRGLAEGCYRYNSKRNELTIVPRDEFIKRVLSDPVLKASFVCIRHVEQHPVYSAEVALLQLAETQAHMGDRSQAIETWEILVRDLDQIEKLAAVDRKRANEPDGIYVASLKRPAIDAMSLLIRVYTRQGETKKAIALGQKMAARISPDGYYWESMNEPLADAYLAGNDGKNAEAQYRIALAGCLDHLKYEDAWAKAGKKKVHPTNWQVNVIRLKKQIQKAGGKIAINTKDVDEILARAAEPEKKGMDLIRKRMKDVHGRKGDLASATGRKAVAEQIAQSARTEKLTTDEVAEVAVVFSYMASEETDADMRRLMLAKMSETVPIAPATESSRDIAPEDREKADRYIKQLCGESVEGGVPHPNSNLADMSVPALLYAAERIERGDLALKARQDITRALVSSENPALYKFFADMVQRAEDKKLTRIAINGLTRIIQNRQSGKR